MNFSLPTENYAGKLLMQELMAMGVAPKIILKQALKK